MKGIILQHYNGEMGELEILSSENIEKYAKKCGVDYKLVTGIVKPGLSNQSQKMCMLDEQWDDYDIVVMMDIDMFTRRGQTKNIFTDDTGVGRHYGIQTHLIKQINRLHPLLANPKYAYWGGSIYRLTKEMRRTLRPHFNMSEAIQFNGNYNDEGIMHRLACLANIKNDKAYYLDKQKWNHASFEDEVEKAEIIHIRPKVTRTGPKRPKIDNYRSLVERGII